MTPKTVGYAVYSPSRGEFVQLDHSSGGYPYLSEMPHIFVDKPLAERCADAWRTGRLLATTDLVVVELTAALPGAPSDEILPAGTYRCPFGGPDITLGPWDGNSRHWTHPAHLVDAAAEIAHGVWRVYRPWIVQGRPGFGTLLVVGSGHLDPNSPGRDICDRALRAWLAPANPHLQETTP